MRRDFLTAEEAAVVLRVSTATIRRHASELGGFKLPGCRRWLFRYATLVEKGTAAA
jgi:excisionase family DNA binding protein